MCDVFDFCVCDFVVSILHISLPLFSNSPFLISISLKKRSFSMIGLGLGAVIRCEDESASVMQLQVATDVLVVSNIHFESPRVHCSSNETICCVLCIESDAMRLTKVKCLIFLCSSFLTASFVFKTNI